MSEVLFTCPECPSSDHYARGYCANCYRRLRRRGQMPRLPRPSDSERFWSQVKKRRNGCWEWQGNVWLQTGYGRFNHRRDGRRLSTPAHRFAYEDVIGVIPADLFACHHCDNRICVNPEHIFLGTPADNSHDMARKGRAYKGYADRTTCLHGHLFTPENTKLVKRGKWVGKKCRACVNAAEADRQRRKRAQAVGGPTPGHPSLLAVTP